MATSSSPADMEAILNGPALPPPIGVSPEFDNPPKSNGSGYGVLTAMMAVGALAVLLRLFAKAFRVKKLRLEDGFGIIAFALYVGYLSCAYRVLEFPGFYVHQWNVRVRDMERILYPFYVASNCYNGMIGCLKTAILLEWLRIFNPTRSRNGFFWSTQIVLWTNILFYSASAIAINLACSPRQMIWDKTMVGGHCINQNNLYLAGTIVNLVSDVTILILPQKIIWGLNMSLKRKIGLSFVFAIGLICCIIACVRITSTIALPNILDQTYNLPSLVFLGTAEMLCGLLVFCVPAFPQAVAGLDVPKFLSHISLLIPSRKTSQRASWDNTEPSWSGRKDCGGNDLSYRRIDELSFKKPTNRDAVAAPNESLHREVGVGKEAGIMRTTEFAAWESYVPEPESEECSHKYAWSQGV